MRDESLFRPLAGKGYYEGCRTLGHDPDLMMMYKRMTPNGPVDYRLDKILLKEDIGRGTTKPLITIPESDLKLMWAITGKKVIHYGRLSRSNAPYAVTKKEQ